MVEDVLQTMKTILEDKLSVELTKQEGKYGDQVKLDTLAQILIGDETITEKGLPLAVLRAESSEIALWATNKKDVSHEISIGIVVSDTDEGASQKKLWRTMRAVESCFEINAPSYNEYIIDYQTTTHAFNVSIFELEESKSTEKGGIISATVLERQDAYVAAQL